MSNILNKKVSFRELFSEGGTITQDEKNHLEALMKELNQNIHTAVKNYKISDFGYVEIPVWGVFRQSGDPKYGAQQWSIGADFLSEEEANRVAKFLNSTYTVDDFKQKQHQIFVVQKSSFPTLIDKKQIERMLKKFNP